jgi:hypothetical protein
MDLEDQRMDIDLDLERIERTYKDLQSSKFYLPYICVSGIFALLMIVRAFLVIIGKITNPNSLVNFVMLMIITGLFFELGWIAWMGQIEVGSNFKHKLFIMDIALCLISLACFIVSFSVHTGILTMVWVIPCAARAVYYANRSKNFLKEAKPVPAPIIGLPSLSLASSIALGKQIIG